MLPFFTLTWMLVFARISAMLLIFPAFSSNTFPARLRVALAAILAYMISLPLPSIPVAPSSLGSIMWLLAIEISVGILLGFVSRIVFFALESAGHIIATQMGLTMTAEFDPFNAARTDALSTMLTFLAITLFFSADMHHWFLIGLQRSFDILPIGQARLSSDTVTDIVFRTSGIFVQATLLAAPIIAVTFLINVVFSVLGRAVPQMNVFLESFAFRIMAGLIVFGLTLELMAQHIMNWLRNVPDDFLRVAQLLGAH